MSFPTTPKLLSIIIGARNDAFMGNFKWRLRTTLECIADSLTRIGRLADVEVVVCDWGSQVPLHRVMSLSPAAAGITRFVVVPPALAQSLQKDSPFPIPIVQNVAIQRSCGRFIAQTDSDVIFPAATVERLLMVLDGGLSVGIEPDKALLVASRRHIPFELALCQPSLAELERYLSRYGAMLPVETLIAGIGTPSGLALMHRDVWHALGAYDERLIYWGWMEIDLYLRATQRYPWQDLAGSGVTLYHMEHYPNNNRSDQPRKANPTQVPVTFTANNGDWGLSGLDLAIERAQEIDAPGDEKGSSHWRLAQISPKPAAQINALIGDSGISWQVDRLQGCLDPRGRQASRFAIEQRLQAGWGFREALVWYAQQMNPLEYLEVGIGAGDTSLHVAANFPPVSIHGIWVRMPGSSRWAMPMPTRLSELLTQVGHKGHVRFQFTADGREVPGMLNQSFSRPHFDLIYVHPTGQAVVGQFGASALLRHLRPGGALVWPSNDPRADLERYRDHLGADTLMLAGAKTLLFLRFDPRSMASTAASRSVSNLFARSMDQDRATYDLLLSQAILKEDDHSAPHHYQHAVALFDQGAAESAFAHLKKATCLQPHCADYRRALADLCMTVRRDPLSALCEYQQALRICPDDDAAVQKLTQIHQTLEWNEEHGVRQ